MSLSLQQREELIAQVADIYEDLQLRIIEDIAARVARGGSAAVWQLARLQDIAPMLNRIRRAVVRADARAVTAIHSAVMAAYLDGGVDAIVALGGQVSMADTAARVTPLARELVGGVTGQGPAILRRSQDIYRDVVARGVAAQLSGVQTRDTVVRRAMRELGDRGVTAFTDRRGRNWNLRSYVDMAMRTGTHLAAQQGHTDQLQAQGKDLVMISKHAHECPLCKPWEGRVLSISGMPSAEEAEYSTGSVDEARAAGLFHPNCRHRMKGYIPGVTRDPPKEQYGPSTYEHAQRRRQTEAEARRWARRRAAATTPEERRAALARERSYREKLKNMAPLPRVNENHAAYERAKLIRISQQGR